MAARFLKPGGYGILLGAMIAAATVLAPALAQAQNPKQAPQRQQKKLPEAPSKLPNIGADRSKGLDFLFGALKAAPDEASAKHVEARIWALWMQTPSDTAALLMARSKAAMDAKQMDVALNGHDHAGPRRRQARARCVPQGTGGQPAPREGAGAGEDADREGRRPRYLKSASSFRGAPKGPRKARPDAANPESRRIALWSGFRVRAEERAPE
jgi:hypothetical protein